MSVVALQKNLLEQPPSPCEKFGCKYQEKCATEQLACDAFLLYLNPKSSRPLHPSTIIIRYNRKNARGKSPIKLTTGPIIPSKKTYWRCFGKKSA